MIVNIRRYMIQLLMLCTSNCLAHADDLLSIYNNLLPDFQKLTPEESALGQYGKYGVSGYTGVPGISIPLFSIGSRSFTIPIELSYDASGIKVDQQATCVGLGWNLMLGGSINHIVCGQNDFCQNSYSANYSSITNLDLLKIVYPSIQYIDAPIVGLASVAFPAISAGSGTCMPIEADRKKFNMLRDVSAGARVSDIFQASFCGHSVTFIMDTNTKMARIISHDATNYQVVLKEYNNYPKCIEITDDHGMIYVFMEALESNMCDHVSYNLSSIKNAAGQSLADFKYSLVKYNILRSYYETVGVADKNYNKPIASESIKKLFIDKNYPNSLEYGVKESYPDTIITERETVIISYGQRTGEDIKYAKQVNKITVRSKMDNSVIHTVDFKYGNFMESTSESNLCNRYWYTNLYNYNRLKLTDVTVDGKKYSFEYNERMALPSRISMKQDFWGYYNGESNTEGFCASPKYQYDNKGELIPQETVGLANRYASEQHCKVGTLSKITYPTGGYTKFDYEINHFDDTNGMYYYPSTKSQIEYTRTEICASGYTGTGYKTTPDTREFDIKEPTTVVITSSSPYYTSSKQYYRLYLSIEGRDANGKLIFTGYYNKFNDKQDFKETHILPTGHYVLSSQFKSVASGLITSGGIYVSFPSEYKEDYSVADGSGKSIGGGLRVKTIENYDNDYKFLGCTRFKYEEGKLLIPTVKKELINMLYLYAVQSATPNIYSIPSTYDCQFFFVTSNPAYPAICSLECPNVGYSKVTTEHYDKNSQLMSYDVDKYYNEGYTEYGADTYFNLFRVNWDGANGKLRESLTYSKDDEIMQKINYSYTSFSKSVPMQDMVFFPWCRCLNMNPDNSSLNVNYKYSLYPKYPTPVLPSAVTETDYVYGAPMKAVTTTFYYKEQNFQPIETTKYVFKNDDTKGTSSTKYWYPEDAEVINSDVTYLVNTHNISEKVKTVTYRNENKITAGYRKRYKILQNGLPVIQNIYSINSDGSEINELNIIDYDSYGNIREYLKKDGIPVAIIWSYNHQSPIMEIIGSTYKQVIDACSSIRDLEEKISFGDNDTDQIKKSYDIIRRELPNTQVTAFAYSPWLTLSRLIKPNGYTIDYSYDKYGRLVSSSDGSGIIQRFYYNFSTLQN